jgi:hypothetical protein
MPAISSGAQLAQMVEEIEAANKQLKWEEYVSIMGAMYDSTHSTAGEAWNLSTAIGSISTAIVDMTQKAFANKVMETLGTAFTAGTISAEDYYTQIELLGTGFMDLSPEQIRASTSLTILNKAMTDGEISSQEYVATTASLIDLVGQSATATEKYAESSAALALAKKEDMGSAEVLARQTENYRQSMVDANTQITTMEEGLTGVTNAVDNGPYNIIVNADDAAASLLAAATQSDNFNKSLSGIANQPRQINFNYLVTTVYRSKGTPPSTAINIGPNAVYGSGGIAEANVPIVVGDAGRAEVFVPGTDGYVYPSLEAFKSAIQSLGPTSSVKNFNMNIQNLMSNQQTVQESFAILKLMER